MRSYRSISLIVVLLALAFVIGVKVGERRVAARAGVDASAEEPCCVWPEGFAPQTEPPPEIPPVPGLPCVAQFGRYETEDCEAAAEVLEGLVAELEGRASVAIVDTEVHRGEADRWRLRMVPTQVFLDADSEEVSRHEGVMAADDVRAALRAAGADLP